MTLLSNIAECFVIAPTATRSDTPLNQVLINKVILTLGLASLIGIFFFPLNYAEAYTQYANINIDKTDYYLGEYGVIITNLDTEVYAKEYYQDDLDTTFVTVEGYISALSGDRLQACVMQMSSSAMACDYQYATSPQRYVEFYINMYEAQ